MNVSLCLLTEVEYCMYMNLLNEALDAHSRKILNCIVVEATGMSEAAGRLLLIAEKAEGLKRPTPGGKQGGGVAEQHARL